MTLKEFAKKSLLEFFLIAVGADVAMFILGSTYNKGMMFSYEILLMPLLYGFVGTIPGWILYSSKELTIKQYLIRKIFHYIFLEILLILVTFGVTNLTIENIKMIVAFAISVLVVGGMVTALGWFLDKKTADNMMSDLVNFQKKNAGV